MQTLSGLSHEQLVRSVPLNTQGVQKNQEVEASTIKPTSDFKQRLNDLKDKESDKLTKEEEHTSKPKM